MERVWCHEQASEPIRCLTIASPGKSISTPFQPKPTPSHLPSCPVLCRDARVQESSTKINRNYRNTAVFGDIAGHDAKYFSYIPK